MMGRTDEALSALLNRFGQSAPELWASLVAAERLEAIIFLIMFLILGTVAWLVFKRIAAKNDDADPVLLLFGAVASFFLISLVSLIVCKTASSLAYPEAKALKTIVERSK